MALHQCCCFSLKTGTIIAGVSCLVFAVFTIAALSYEGITESRAWTAYDYTHIFFLIIDIVASIFLLYGTKNEQKWYFLPWMIFQGFSMVLYTVVIIVIVVLVAWQFCLLFLLLIPGWFFWLVVYSYFMDIKNRQNVVKSYEVNRTTPSAPITGYPQQYNQPPSYSYGSNNSNV